MAEAVGVADGSLDPPFPPIKTQRGELETNQLTMASHMSPGVGTSSATMSIDDILNSLPSFSGRQSQRTSDSDDQGAGEGAHGKEGRGKKTQANKHMAEPPAGFVAVELKDTMSTQKAAVSFGMTESEFRTINRLNTQHVFPKQVVFVRDQQEHKAGETTLFPFKGIKEQPRQQEQHQQAAARRAAPATARGNKAPSSSSPDVRRAASLSRVEKKSRSGGIRQLLQRGFSGERDNGRGRSKTASTGSDTGSKRRKSPFFRRRAVSASTAKQRREAVQRFGALSYASTAPSAGSALHQVPKEYLADNAFNEQEFINDSFINMHVLFVTDGQGVIPGSLAVTPDFVEFHPDDSALVRELGATQFSFHLDMVDLLPPRTQRDAPDFRPGKRKLLPAGAFHRSASSAQGDLPFRESEVVLPSGSQGNASILRTASTSDEVTVDIERARRKVIERHATQPSSETATTKAAGRARTAVETKARAEVEGHMHQGSALPKGQQEKAVAGGNESDANSPGVAAKTAPGQSMLQSMGSDDVFASEPSGPGTSTDTQRRGAARGGRGDDDDDDDGDDDKRVEAAQAAGTQAVAAAATKSSAVETPKGGARQVKPTAATSQDDELYYPYYLELRLQLIFGRKPTAETTTSYWVAVSPRRIDVLYEFIRQHASAEQLAQEWEVVDYTHLPMTELRRIAGEEHAKRSFPEPVLLNTPKIISKDDFAKLVPHLPPLERCMHFEKVYASYEHGISLSTLYRCALSCPGPSILLVRDFESNVFGAFVTDTWEPSKSYFGGGTSFLFKMTPEFKVFNWTGNNTYVQLASKDSLVVGGGEGAYGLWLEETFTDGSSQACSTFDNEPLSSSPRFKVHEVELWGFVRSF